MTPEPDLKPVGPAGATTGSDVRKYPSLKLDTERAKVIAGAVFGIPKEVKDLVDVLETLMNADPNVMAPLTMDSEQDVQRVIEEVRTWCKQRPRKLTLNLRKDPDNDPLTRWVSVRPYEYKPRS